MVTGGEQRAPTLEEKRARLRELLERQASAPTEVSPPEESAQLPLSASQQATWFLQRFAPESSAYNIATAWRIASAIDRRALSTALFGLTERHSMLRARFPARDGEPAQQLGEPSDGDLRTIDASGWDERALREAVADEANRPIDLEERAPLRARLFAVAPDDHVLLLTVHHIAMDGWSSPILWAELLERYRAALAGALPELGPPPAPYAEFVAWQQDMLAGEDGQRLLEYWRDRLSGEPARLLLPTDRPRPRTQRFRGATVEFSLGEELSGRVKTLAREQATTLYTLLLAAYQVLLHRYTAQRDVLVSSPIAGRARPEFERTIGCFTNSVIVRGRPDPWRTFDDFLAEVRDTVAGALTHQDYPLPRLVRDLLSTRDGNPGGFADVTFVLQSSYGVPAGRTPDSARGPDTTQAPSRFRIELGGLDLEEFPVDRRSSTFDLELHIYEVGGVIDGRIQYDTDLFDRQTIVRMSRHFENLLGAISTDPGRAIARLDMLGANEQRQLTSRWNDTGRDFSEESIHRSFERQAARAAERVAVVADGTSVTYGELDARASRLAQRFSASGLGPEDVVAICMGRSVGLVVGLLAVLKAGAAYVPLDPAYPPRRIDTMLQDSGAKLVVSDHACSQRVESRGVPVLRIDDSGLAGEFDDASDEALGGLREAAGTDPDRGEVAPQSLAYVIYTSGSTGRPKGVMITHRSVQNFFAGMDHRIGCGPEDTMLALTSISFDISVAELLWTLCRGATVIVSNGSSLRGRGSRRGRGERAASFGLFYFATGDADSAPEQYRLVLEGARFADEHGFAAVWTPERHFHAFGGIFPNPSVMAAAIATSTRRVGIRAGSIVLPLHDPIRVAEEWALVDNLSGGRVGLAAASGWHADDFALRPDAYTARKEITFRHVDTLRRLWRGEAITVSGGTGEPVDVRILPRPLQPELPLWITSAGTRETFVEAGRIGAGVLTHLLGQDVGVLTENVRAYREARAGAGHDPESGRVALMLHTFLGESEEQVREIATAPFRGYLRSSLGLVRSFAKSIGAADDLESLTERDLDALLDAAVDRFWETSALFGTPESCRPLVEMLLEAGIDEFACLIDFGIETDRVLSGLSFLDELRSATTEPPRSERGFTELVRDHRPTLLQCTPSLMRMITEVPGALEDLSSLRALLLGGEALPRPLAGELVENLEARVVNLYGPTETTIWSAAGEVDGTEPVRVGLPIANTQIHVLGEALELLPASVPGELYIGGAGVARGYLGSPRQTAERFLPDPFSRAGGRLYRTGDLARRHSEGALEILGRADQQVKVGGVRIELGEIEAQLVRQDAVSAAAVVGHANPLGPTELIAYLVPADAALAPLLALQPERVLAGAVRSDLDNGMTIASHGGFQTIAMYREVFEEDVYFRHGIELPERACVFDVGANIGMFSLRAQQERPDVQVFAFEPIEANFRLLEANIALYGLDVLAFRCGLFDRAGTAEFSFFPQATGLSTCVADADAVREVTRSVVRSWISEAVPREQRDAASAADLDRLVEGALTSETTVCPLRTLSEVIAENSVERVDLLKIDVEDSEISTLR